MNFIEATQAAIKSDQQMRRKGWHPTVSIDIPDRATHSWYRSSTAKPEDGEVYQLDPYDVIAEDWEVRPNPFADFNRRYTEAEQARIEVESAHD